MQAEQMSMKHHCMHKVGPAVPAAMSPPPPPCPLCIKAKRGEAKISWSSLRRSCQSASPYFVSRFGFHASFLLVSSELVLRSQRDTGRRGGGPSDGSRMVQNYITGSTRSCRGLARCSFSPCYIMSGGKMWYF